MTVAEFIVMLQAAPQDAVIHMPDTGCGCCSYYHGVGVEKQDRIHVLNDERVLLFGSLPTEPTREVQATFVKKELDREDEPPPDLVGEIMKKFHDPDHVWEL